MKEYDWEDDAKKSWLLAINSKRAKIEACNRHLRAGRSEDFLRGAGFPEWAIQQAVKEQGSA